MSLKFGIAAAILLLLLVQYVTAGIFAHSYNASNYSIIFGALSAGTIGNTNVSDGASLDFLENASANSTGGMVVFQGTASTTQARYQTWSGAAWSATSTANTPATAGTLRFPVVRASPVRDEKILGTYDSNSDVDVQVWNGTAWSATTEMTASGPIATKRVFDIAYEQVTGDALIVYANTTAATLSYRIWNGTGFSPQGSISIGTAGVTNRIVALYPRQDRDQIMVLVSDGSAIPKLYAILWNGTAFDNSTNVKIADFLDATSAEQGFDARWEDISGDFNAFYENDTVTTNILMKTYNGTWSGEIQGATGADGDIRYVQVARFPGTDAQMVCWLEFTAGDLNCQYYSGTAFGTMFSDNTVEVGAVGRNFDIAPLLNTDGGFVVMYGNLNSDWFDFMVCTSAANCNSATISTRVLWSTTQLGGVDTRWGQIYADPYNPGNFTLVGTSQTATNGWYRARVYCDAASCVQSEAWTSLGATSSVVYEGASFTFDAHKFYRSEVWYNSTPTVNLNVNSYINVTAMINVTASGNYSLSIYNWTSGGWFECNESILSPGPSWVGLNCNMTAALSTLRSPDSQKLIRIAINGTYNHTLRGIVEADFLQFYLDANDSPPKWNAQSSFLGVTNSTPIPGQNITFYSYWYDDVALGAYWLEENSSAAFTNRSALAFSASNDTWGNYSFVIPNSSEGRRFAARIWANDSANQLNFTTYISVAVANVSPSVGNTGTNVTSAYTNTLICINATATDIGVGINTTWAMVTFPSGTVANITLSDTGCNAGGAGDGIYGAYVNVSGTVGNLTINTTFANDSIGNRGFQSPFPNIKIQISLPPNPIGGPNAYVGFYGQTRSRIVNATGGSYVLYQNNMFSGTLYVASAGATVTWANLRRAVNTTDMLTMDTNLGLTATGDKLETNYNYTGSICGIANVGYLNSTDGKFRIGVLFSDENGNSVYNTGDNIIFCTDFKPNSLDFSGGYSNYEIVFPKSFANSVDLYFDA